MRQQFVLAMGLLICMTFGVPAGAADDAELAAFKQAIRAKYDMKEKAFRERDGETIVTKFYAEDVVSTGEGSPLHQGRAELRKLYQMPEVINSNVRIVSFNTHVNGDAGWDWADFHVTPADPKDRAVHVQDPLPVGAHQWRVVVQRRHVRDG